MPKRMSLVFGFLEQRKLKSNDSGSPQPEFMKRMRNQLCANLGTAAGEADYDEAPPRGARGLAAVSRRDERDSGIVGTAAA